MNSPALFASSSSSPHPHLDLDDQMFAADAHKGRLHNEWVQGHQAKTTMDHSCSRVKALLLVKEAQRLEMIHLQHQRDHATFLLQRCNSHNNNNKKNIVAAALDKKKLMMNSSADDNTTTKDCSCFSPSRHTPSISPPRGQSDDVAQSPDVPSISSVSSNMSDSGLSPSRRAARDSFQQNQNQHQESSSSPCRHKSCNKSNTQHRRSNSCPPPPSPVACGCLHVAAWRLMTPRCRVMALLKKHGEKGNLENIVEALRQTYTSDAEMIEDMDARYGPEPTNIDPELLLQSSIERMDGHRARWAAIREDVDAEMCSSPHAFQNVIRTLSVMRIFIEGSQGQSYGIDFSDRQRREAAQQAVLAKLRANRALFIDQCSSPSRQNSNNNNDNNDNDDDDLMMMMGKNDTTASSSDSFLFSNKSKGSAVNTTTTSSMLSMMNRAR